MKIRAQFSLVFNLDKCIGCHTCSVTCKNVWTNRKGVEYAWFNNVESKPGIGYPKNWEDQDVWHGGWELFNNKLRLKSGSRLKRLMNIFANPDLPVIDDYYEPYTYNYGHLQTSPLSEAAPTARPMSQLDGGQMEKVSWGPNWEDDLAGEFKKRSQDKNFANIEKQIYSEFEHTFQMYLPRMCNHCLNPSCVASCPAGSMYKREEDGIVLVDQNKCRGWRMCVSNCPYKKVFYNWESGKAEKCIACYPRVEAGLPTVCSESCVGRIRYNGIMLYDADKIKEAASTENEQGLYEAQLDIFVDPNDPEVIANARENGVSCSWIEAAQKSPIYKMAVEWRVAFPLHPEFRTLPMVWYVPPLAPVQSQIDQGNLPTEEDGMIPKAEALRMPVQYLANLFTAGDEKPILKSINRLIAMRSYQRTVHVDKQPNQAILDKVGLSVEQVEDMYRYMAIANYEDRFVVPTSQEELRQDDFHAFQGTNGIDFGNTSPNSGGKISLFPTRRQGSMESLVYVAPPEKFKKEKETVDS
ncbi:MAG TPA: nitrate reductase subunit beta [Acidiferrobacteraceae bacterium]|nr:nitrate reductase subunit beta [Acidiferrobacteraceae bacterium]